MSFTLGPNALRGKPIPTCGMCGHETTKHSYSTLTTREIFPGTEKEEETKIDVYLCDRCDFNQPHGDGE